MMLVLPRAPTEMIRDLIMASGGEAARELAVVPRETGADAPPIRNDGHSMRRQPVQPIPRSM